ncbi:MAG: zinc ribbon domain-containing protein [Thermoplasmata archaeon]|nr:MAG: zinc ribbon domain-containing protein [Thermoplasmata archaeon]
MRKMPYCPNCNIQVPGNTCTNCGRPLVAPPPTQQGAPGQTAQPMPPPPSPPPQYQQPVPSQASPTQTATMPQQTAPQQPQAQPQYAPYTQPGAQAPPTPPKKSKKGAIIAIVTVVVILLIASFAYLLFFKPEEDDKEIVRPGATITAKQLGEDWHPFSGTFGGLDDGDTIIIRDKIKEIEHVGIGSSIYGDVNWTLITFDSTGMTLEGFYSGDYPSTDLFGLMIFSGNLTSDYQPGDQVDVDLTIVDYTIVEDQIAELPEWYVDIMEAYQGNIAFEDIEFPDSSTISHTGE